MWQSRHQGHSESPQSCPLPDCLLNSPPSFALTLFFCSGHSTFLDILECSTWIHQDFLYLDTSWSSYIEESPPLWLANLLLSSRFQLNCHWFREVFPLVFISLLSGHFRPFLMSAAAAAKSLQLFLTPFDPIEGSPPDSPIPRILQARTLQWVAISFSNAWRWSRSVVSHSLRPHGLQPIRLLHPWDFPGKSTGVGWHCLLRFSFLACTKVTIHYLALTSRKADAQEMDTHTHTHTHTAHIKHPVDINAIGKVYLKLRASKSDLRKLITFLLFLLAFNFELLYLTSKFILGLIQNQTPDSMYLQTYSILSLTS